MRIQVCSDTQSLARAAAHEAASRIRAAIADGGRARIIAATGTSQIAFLDALVRAPDVDWSRVEMFHLDEYIGLSADHPASFRRYLLERLVRPTGIARVHLIDGDREPAEVCRALGRELTALLRARRGFMERGLAYEVAVISLDLSTVYVKLGAVEDLRQTVVETMPIFRSLRVGREALGALLQLQQIADQEHQALELIRAITAQLERLSNRKSLGS